MSLDGVSGLRLVITGGGTGGHLFPGLALAEELKGFAKDMEIVFIGARRGLEEKIVPGLGYRFELLDVEGLKKRKGAALLRSLVKAVFATFRAMRILRGLKPSGVIGTGSYSAGPVVLAARLLGIKTAVIEQNAIPGLTNRFLGRFVDKVYIAFEQAAGYFPVERTILSGTPVRREIISMDPVSERSPKFTLFVFGGSQGATAINAAFLDAAEYLTDIWHGLRVIHQTGEAGYSAAKAAYERKGLKAELYSFIDDMAHQYAQADLAVCRAGATTIAEVAALGLPAILVPYPFATDAHQEMNARCIEAKGAAIMLKQDELTGSSLARIIRRLYEDRTGLERLKHRMRELGRPGAAMTIREDFMKLLKEAA
ncbi:MAG: undecaprenyldiphospho-muramoylpentapeptide beta-N-acetylglucosaminyltransferase [Deltaproteobacteria bacterium]|nr:undecaprenyldiphospho-muramoylpentapeptide beta-N-acetylglucosaminyltransferase [Deltaproteobacteria bacterium]